MPMHAQAPLQHRADSDSDIDLPIVIVIGIDMTIGEWSMRLDIDIDIDIDNGPALLCPVRSQLISALSLCQRQCQCHPPLLPLLLTFPLLISLHLDSYFPCRSFQFSMRGEECQ